MQASLPSKIWSCATLDEGIAHVLQQAKTEMPDDEETRLIREIQEAL